MSEKGYEVKIVGCNKELTVKEKVMLKDASDAIKLDEATQTEGSIIITPELYASLEVHNERSENKDYNVYIVIDKDGQKYTTGSQSFWNSFIEIMEDMEESDEDFSIKVYRKPSKNRQGKDFITCSII